NPGRAARPRRVAHRRRRSSGGTGSPALATSTGGDAPRWRTATNPASGTARQRPAGRDDPGARRAPRPAAHGALTCLVNHGASPDYKPNEPNCPGNAARSASSPAARSRCSGRVDPSRSEEPSWPSRRCCWRYSSCGSVAGGDNGSEQSVASRERTSCPTPGPGCSWSAGPPPASRRPSSFSSCTRGDGRGSGTNTTRRPGWSHRLRIPEWSRPALSVGLAARR
ncbi:MAG: hypothetical protein V7646_3436, partial [Pseudonocardia sp.]